MKINIIKNSSPNFKNKTAPEQTDMPVQEKSKKETFLDKFETNVRNSADLNDTIQVPRTIFKGYMAFTVGTALVTVAMIAKNKLPKLSNALNFASAAFVIYGTYSFVRPYLIKSKPQSKEI